MYGRVFTGVPHRICSVQEIVKELEKDSLFYFHSGGGVTISGGEPFLQPDFLCELLEDCIMLGMNTAIETSGFTHWKNIEKALPFLDTVFFDLKHMDNETHEKITGVSNLSILKNLKQLDESPGKFNLIVRMPVIPTLNDSNDSNDSNAMKTSLPWAGFVKTSLN